MNLFSYDNKIVRVTDHNGRVTTGIAKSFPSVYGLHEYNREEEGLHIGNCVIFESQMKTAEELSSFALIRATETWQQAGAYYVRIQAMAKKHHIALRQEFDEHDAPKTKYIVVTDSDFPIATARMYPLDDSSVMIGRVVVLPEYRRQGIGSMVVHACEDWAKELGYEKTVLESRDNKVGFYEKLGYKIIGEAVDGDTFRCIRMEKDL